MCKGFAGMLFSCLLNLLAMCRAYTGNAVLMPLLVSLAMCRGYAGIRLFHKKLQLVVQSRPAVTNALSSKHCFARAGTMHAWLCSVTAIKASFVSETGSTKPFPVSFVCYVQGSCRHSVFAMYSSDWLYQAFSCIHCVACAGVMQACSLLTAVAASCTTETGCTKCPSSFSHPWQQGCWGPLSTCFGGAYGESGHPVPNQP